MRTKTANGENAHSQSGNPHVDLFFNIGSARNNDSALERVDSFFTDSLNKDPQVGSAIISWARDIRKGAGERSTFRRLFKQLITKNPAMAEKVLNIVPELGRFDDLVVAIGSPLESKALDIWAKGITDGNLLASKWVDLKKSNKLRNHMKMSPKDFRKMIVKNRTGIVEQLMSSKEFDKINYPHVPSVAMSRYRNAFKKNDETRFDSWANDKTTKVNVGAVYPYDVVKMFNNTKDDVLASKLWNALKLEVASGIIPIVDTSSSMSSPSAGGLSCMDMAMAIGMFISQKQSGSFQNYLLNFHDTPKFYKLPKTDSFEKIYNFTKHMEWGGTTNFHLSYKLILELARVGKITQADMPKYLLVLSDMQFNQAMNARSVSFSGGKVQQTGFEKMKAEFNASGYELPTIIFWNLSPSHGNFPTISSENGVAMVSGFSPNVLKAIFNGNLYSITPESVMMETINPYIELLKTI